MSLRVFTAFSGYDSQLMALRNIGVVAFDCVCGCKVEYSTEHRYADIDDIENCEDDWEGQPASCMYCGRTYKIENRKAKLLK